MRNALLIALALLTSGCSLPFGLKFAGFPWQWKKPAPTYCMVSIEVGNSTGIGPAPQGSPPPVELACRPSAVSS